MVEPQPQVRVVKIGGSLLELNDLKRRIDDWLQRQLPMTTVWIVGGGAQVNEIRKLDPQNQSPENIHWKCIKRMDDNSARVATVFPTWKQILSFEVNGFAKSDNLILSPYQWCRDYAAHLPMNWDVTSDSISAALAQWMGATELVLLKSAAPPSGTDVEAAIENGFVDRHFQRALTDKNANCDHPDFAVRVVNLRSNSFAETVWR